MGGLTRASHADWHLSLAPSPPGLAMSESERQNPQNRAGLRLRRCRRRRFDSFPHVLTAWLGVAADAAAAAAGGGGGGAHAPQAAFTVVVSVSDAACGCGDGVGRSCGYVGSRGC